MMRLTMATNSSNADEVTRGMAFHVSSAFAMSKKLKVMTVLAAPAAVAKSPPAKRLATMICCFLGKLSFLMTGIGSSTRRKSVIVLIHPAASRCSCWLMQFCGVADSVQYAEIGLH